MTSKRIPIDGAASSKKGDAVMALTKTSLRLLRQIRTSRPSIGKPSSLESPAGKPTLNTARTATSSAKDNLRIPCSTSDKAR